MSDASDAQRAHFAQRRGAILAVSAAAFAAGFLIVIQEAMRAAPRDTVVLAMLGWAALLNTGTSLARLNRPVWPSRIWWVTVFSLAAMTLAGNVGVAGALGQLDAGLTATILQTQVFFVGIGARIFLHESITGRFVFGASLALAGFAVLGLSGDSAATLSAAGVGFALLAALSFSAMLVLTRGVIAGLDPLSINAARLIVAVACFAALPGQAPALAALSPRVWLLTAAAAVAGPFASRLCLMYALRHIGAGQTKLLSLLSPVFAFALAFAVYRTLPSSREMFGGVLILLGVVLPSLRRRG